MLNLDLMLHVFIIYRQVEQMKKRMMNGLVKSTQYILITFHKTCQEMQIPYLVNIINVKLRLHILGLILHFE